MSYPTTTSVPKLGDTGDAVRSYQQSLNTQFKSDPNFTPLAEDGKYGPKTLAASNYKPGTLVVTSKQTRAQNANYSNQLNEALAGLSSNAANYNTNTNGAGTGAKDGNDTEAALAVKDPYTKMLDELSSRSDDATKRLILSVQAKRTNQANDFRESYDNYKSGLQLLGIQHNEAQSTPELLSGHIQKAENDLQKKITSLDFEETKAIMDAQDAQTKNQMDVVKEKMDHYKDIKKQKTDALKDAYDQMHTEQQIGDIQAKQIYGQLQKLGAGEKEVFLQQVAKTYNIPLQALVSSVAAISSKGKKGKAAAGTATSTTTGGTTTVTKKDWGDIESTLQSGYNANGVKYNGRGDDGYVDPNLYMALYNNLGLSAQKTFLSKYPIKKFVNPASYGLLPVNVRPKTTGGGGA